MGSQTVYQLATALQTKIIYPIIALIVAVGLVVFIYGLIEYLAGLSTDVGDGKEKGKRHMFFGLLGMFIMVAAFAILQLIAKIVCSGGLNGCILR